jgi:hypothetical protein
MSQHEIIEHVTDKKTDLYFNPKLHEHPLCTFPRNIDKKMARTDLVLVTKE